MLLFVVSLLVCAQINCKKQKKQNNKIVKNHTNVKKNWYPDCPSAQFDKIIGETFEFSNIKYKVHEEIRSKNRIGRGYRRIKARNGAIFLIVPFSVETSERESSSVPSPISGMTLVTDKEEEEFNPSSRGMNAIGYRDYSSSMLQLHPHLPVKLKVVFEIPKYIINTKFLMLSVSDVAMGRVVGYRPVKIIGGEGTKKVALSSSLEQIYTRIAYCLNKVFVYPPKLEKAVAPEDLKNFNEKSLNSLNTMLKEIKNEKAKYKKPMIAINTIRRHKESKLIFFLVFKSRNKRMIESSVSGVVVREYPQWRFSLKEFVYLGSKESSRKWFSKMKNIYGF